MSNTNPIKTSDSGSYPSYKIPASFKDKTLFVTTTTSINDPKWKLDLLHSISLNGDTLDFNPQPDIERAEIGKCSDIDANRFSLCSTASRLRNGAATNAVPTVTYKILFELDNETFEEFEITTDSTNPASLYTKITFDIES